MSEAPDRASDRLPHGYTNLTARFGDTVRKRYLGPDAEARAGREQAALRALAGVLPVPRLLRAGPTETLTAFVDGGGFDELSPRSPGLDQPPDPRARTGPDLRPRTGADLRPRPDPNPRALSLSKGEPARHGQEVLETDPAAVLYACGRLLTQLQAVDPAIVLPGAEADSGVVVHGDFGPNNLLFAADSFDAIALLDWEFCHRGEPIEDLAWAEWIVRAHHPAVVAELPALFAGYGHEPAWADRRRAMLERCAEHERFCERWDDGGAGAAMWRERAAVTASWRA